MKRRAILAMLAVTSSLCQVDTVMGSSDLIPYQFANCGVEFGYKEIPVRADEDTLSTSASLPTHDAPQRAFKVEHPDYVREIDFLEFKGRDGRELVKDTTEWPHSVFGQLQLIFAEGAGHGSGTLVSPHHVLTCAHNVYDADTRQWAKEIKFIPGLNGGLAPFGIVPVIGAFIYKAWEEIGDPKADIALLTLAQPIGLKTGWAGLMATDTQTLKMARPEITGYPGDKGGVHMWTMFDRFKAIADTQFTYVIDTYAGQSGSGVWIGERGRPYLLGVHTAGCRKRQENIGTRISTAYLTQLHELMSRTGELKAKITIYPGSGDPLIKIPEIAKGYEKEYRQFLRGKLIYKPDSKSDVGKIELPIAALTNPLNGTFDIRGCGDLEKYLSIATGYRRGKTLGNENKVEVWIAPRFVLERDPAAQQTAKEWRELNMEDVPFAVYFNMGGWDDSCYDVAGINFKHFENSIAHFRYHTKFFPLDAEPEYDGSLLGKHQYRLLSGFFIIMPSS